AEAMRQSGERGWALYRKMGSPRKIVAPMVDQSELAFRMLARKYGAELCYTPMINSKILLEDHTYRSTNLDLECPEDRPLIVQFCGNDPGVMAAAAQLVDRRCDAVDINLGCPQNIARRGRYGAFLLEEWDLLQDMVWAMHCSAKVPVTCKVRLLQESVEDTIELCKLLVGAGAAMLTVHGRTRMQVGCLAGVCNWDAIRRIREAVPVPVFANGGIGCIEDFEECLRVTGAAGVMVSEVVLSNPAFFAPNAPGPCGVAPTSESMCREYLALARRFPPKRYVSGILRGHVFKLLFTALSRCEDLRPVLAVSHSLEDVERVSRA
ncbi:putative tRNA-dihydrouridine synthase, partial [Tribonema minus]